MNKLGNRGMSLVELLIGVGVLGILTLLITQMFSNNLQQIKYLETKLEQNNIINFAQIDFSDPIKCISNFQDITIAPGSMVAGGEITISKNLLRLGNGLAKDYPVTNFELDDFVFQVATTATGSDASGTLLFGFLPKAGTSGSWVTMKRQGFSMYLTVDASGKIITCPRPSPVPLAIGGVAPVAKSSSGSYTQSLPTGAFTSPPIIFISPLWSRFSGDEDTAWWITNVTTTEFTINWHGPGKGSSYGTDGVMWKAEAY